MIDGILSILAQSGWEVCTYLNSGYAIDRLASRGVLFTYLPDANLEFKKAINARREIKKWDVVIVCLAKPESSDLRRFPAKLTQAWYWDVETGHLFPYPPNKKNDISRLLEQIAEGGPVYLFSSQARHDKAMTPYATYALISLNLALFLLMFFAGLPNNNEVLIRFGAKVNSLIEQGQVWRLLTSSFLHANLFHLGFNLYALWALGPFTENLYGRRRFLLLYLASGVGGNVASYLFSPAISVGASGSIFGLLGVLLVYAWRHKELWRSGFGLNLLLVTAVNLIFGLTQPQIDNYAHMGGLITGSFLGLWVRPIKK